MGRAIFEETKNSEFGQCKALTKSGKRCRLAAEADGYCASPTHKAQGKENETEVKERSTVEILQLPKGTLTPAEAATIEKETEVKVKNEPIPVNREIALDFKYETHINSYSALLLWMKKRHVEAFRALSDDPKLEEQVLDFAREHIDELPSPDKFFKKMGRPMNSHMLRSHLSELAIMQLDLVERLRETEKSLFKLNKLAAVVIIVPDKLLNEDGSLNKEALLEMPSSIKMKMVKSMGFTPRTLERESAKGFISDAELDEIIIDTIEGKLTDAMRLRVFDAKGEEIREKAREAQRRLSE